MIQRKSVPLGMLCLLPGVIGLTIGLVTRQWLISAAFATFAAAGVAFLSDRTAFLSYALIFSSIALSFLRGGLAPRADASAEFIAVFMLASSVAMWLITALIWFIARRSRESGPG